MSEDPDGAPLRFSDDELARRHLAVRRMMTEQELDALVMYKTLQATDAREDST